MMPTMQDWFWQTEQLLVEMGVVPWELHVPPALYARYKDEVDTYAASQGLKVVVQREMPLL